MIKKRLNVDPESLVPKLPSPQDLKPFPNAKMILYATEASEKVSSERVKRTSELNE